MANVTGQLSLSTNWSQVITGVPGSSQQIAAQQSPKFVVTASGTAADQADLKYTSSFTLAATPTILNLKSLLDIFGGAIVLVKVRSITIVNKATTDAFVLLMGYATTTSNAWTSLVTNPGQITIAPSTATNNGMFAMTAPNTTGWAVGTSNRLLNLDPGANSIPIDIEIVGTSA